MNMKLREKIALQLKLAMESHPTLHTQKALEAKSGVGQATIGRVLRAEVDVRTDSLQALANALGKPVGYFFTGNEKKAIQGNAEWVGDLDPWDDGTPLGEEEVEVPLFREVALAAGMGAEVVRESDGAKLRFSKHTLRKAGVDAGATACAKVSGNSMEPVLLDGTTVGIDTSKTQIKDGDLYAIDHGGLLRIKLLYRMPANGLRIVSYNRDEWPDEYLDEEKSREVRIIGRVFWWSTLR